ncbi:MAG: glycosyltransferase family 2 protein [Candidatus Omnitrophica bacterium]|nr:glycosyltransferase family 2 protein [Candidatus Omnitrophota bacterium]
MSAFVSVIIPLYNGERVIGDCLDSVLRSSYQNFEIVIVDDASTDSSVVRIAPYLSSVVRVLQNRKNIGFGKSINIGLKKARGDIVVLLNMDTVVDDKWLCELVDTMISGNEIGVAGSKIFYMDGKTIQHAGGIIDGIGRSYHVGRGELDRGQYDSLKEVEYVCGAAIGIKKEVLEKIGCLDEGFTPLYYEEIDFMMRAKKAGYKVVYVPKAMLRHYERYSIGESQKAFYDISKNRIRFVYKHFTFGKIFKEFLFNECRFFLTLTRYKQAQLFSAHIYNMLRLPVIALSRI